MRLFNLLRNTARGALVGDAFALCVLARAPVLTLSLRSVNARGAWRTTGAGAGSFALELGGVHAGWLVSASGGDAEGVVVSEPGTDGVIRKRVGGVRYADIELSVDAGLSKQLSGWLAGMIGRKPVPKDGVFLCITPAGAARARRRSSSAGPVAYRPSRLDRL
jgi:hypothetical protein